MAYLTTTSMIRGELSVLIRTVMFVFILLTTHTNMAITAPLQHTTKSYEDKTPTMVVSTEKGTVLQGSLVSNSDTSKILQTKNQNETQYSNSQLRHAHDVRYLQNFPFMVLTTHQVNNETPVRTVTTKTSMFNARPSSVALKQEANKHVSKEFKNNPVKSINLPSVTTDTKTNLSLPQNIPDNIISPDEPLSMQKLLIQFTTKTPKKEKDIHNPILLLQPELLSTRATLLPKHKILSEIFQKQEVKPESIPTRFDKNIEKNKLYDINENITESAIIDLPSEVKHIFNYNSQQNPAIQNSTTNYTVETKDEQKKHQKLKDMERHSLKSINKIHKHPQNAGSDDFKTTMNKKSFDNQGASFIKTINATNKNKNKSKENWIYRKNVWQTHRSPTLKPIQNGFLGPIHMEEKTFSVIHRGKEALHHQSHIRDEKFVEIIAPKIHTKDPSSKEIETDTVSTTLNTQHEMKSTAVLSTTVFQVQDLQTSTTHFPSSTQFQSISLGKHSLETTPQLLVNNQQTESKISDIQIEVYDSTVDSIISSTNFKESDGYFSSSFETDIAATKPPMLSSDQDKFTQYVIDHTDSSTEKSYMASIPFAAGVPEPAAIEIHINVSEGHDNESEDLEFSYHQPEYLAQYKPGQGVNASLINKKSSAIHSKLNNSSSMSEQSDEILVVEIIDSGDNSTENSASFENLNVNPIFTFCSDTVKHVVSKNSHQKPEANNLKLHTTDDLFMPDVRKDNTKNQLSLTAPTPSEMPQKLVPDRDSDTIFYISNTEVKVGESLPTANINTEQQLKKTRLENQFFPVNYKSSTHPNTVKLEEPHRYEEDIILSPIHNSANLVKIFRSPGESSPPLDVTYVGESVMEVEQSSGVDAMITSSSYSPLGTQRPDVIIEPAILPEISIGVPIIGELPPQIELKEIDYMPFEENDNDAPGNEVERIMESSIQYGGDLIDEGGVIGGGGFDGIEGSYPFANPAFDKPHLRTVADFSDISVNNHISNLKKDDLIADVSGSAELSLGSLLENGTLMDISRKNASDLIINGTIEEAVHSENATLFHNTSSVEDEDTCLSDVKTLFLAWFSTLLPLFVAIVLVFGLRYLYRRFRTDEKNVEDIDTEEPTEWPSQTDHLPTITSTDVIVATNSKSRNNSRDKLIELSNTNSVSNECCTLGSYAAFAASDCNSKASPNRSSSVHSSYIGPNGSVTTMTLKNNHLIVETEERNDISRDTRETKMHYSTTEKDGIFVVEVSRGIDSKSLPDSPVTRTNQNLLALETIQNCSTVVSGNDVRSLANNHEEVQIHQPPQENNNVAAADELQMVLHQIEEVDESIHSPNSTIKQRDVVDFNYGRMSNTGLSQSDLSSTSSTDSNKRYSYGNQELYTSEKPIFLPLLPTIQSPLQTAAGDADDDHQSENGQSTIQTATKLQSITTQNNKNQESEKPTNPDSQLNVTSSREQCQDTLSGEKIFSENLKQQLNRNYDEDTSTALVIHKLISESSTENLESNYNGYDSIISLPDPPSIEEIKQLNDCSFIESNQLDSLPPPPPPPLLMADLNGHEYQQEETIQHDDLYVEGSKIQHENGLKTPLQVSSNLSSKNSISPAPLTPPASPPHYTNGGKGIPTPIAMVVNVNGS